MAQKIVIIGIDSLDPYVLKKYQDQLPHFSKLIEASPTFVSNSIFPVDTVPAWSSIYTGLDTSSHGILYVYDVFDPTLDGLKNVNIDALKGNTFWDYAGQKGLRSVIVYPNMIFPAWDINGIMVCKSPFDKKINPLETEIDISVSPKSIAAKHNIPRKLKSVWGGFPGNSQLKKWAEYSMESLRNETKTAFDLYEKEPWDIFFVYFNMLDIIQHRLWRFFDTSDPSYRYNNDLSGIILNFYKEFDLMIDKFSKVNPDANLFVISDHGHKSRPTKTLNLDEFLRINGYLKANITRHSISTLIRKMILTVVYKLQIEHYLISIITKSKTLAKTGKSIYSSGGLIIAGKSVANLSRFAGIKSYSYGGIEINKKLIPESDYNQLRDDLIKSISEITDTEGTSVIKWIARREDKFKGKFTDKLFPDLNFELEDDYCVGWDLGSSLYGKSYDHNVASGGHRNEAVFLMRNIPRHRITNKIGILDLAPTIMKLLNISIDTKSYDGKSFID
jgi:predicted AlkP superfamily phosphohydrolase/phosphomutase